jgi:hypothetical protein
MGQWTMRNDDKKFEEYLTEFQPREPRALPDHVIPKTIWARRLAAAAAVIIALGVSLWPVREKVAGRRAQNVASTRPVKTEEQTSRRAPSLVVLTRLAVENPSGLDAALKATQENQLPRFDRKNSALRILATE